MKLVFKQDCTNLQLSSDLFFHNGDVQIIEDSCGKYLQASEAPMSRFGYRIQLQSKIPHLLKVRYPDNRKRFMTIGDGTSYDASCAIVTGHAWEISNQMQELKEIFWPRFSDFSLCFMTWGFNEAAAVESFEIYELSEDELAPLEINCPNGRKFGIQYEDPCGTQASEGAQNFKTWQEHLFTYLAHTGQNTFIYPMCWYHGPWFPGTRERAQHFAMTVADDRKQYIVWDDNPRDWVRELLDNCEKNSIDFYGEFTLLRLESLMKKMNIDQTAIENGEATLNNVLSNNLVQSGTMDWTSVYHSSNYPQMLVSDDPFNTAEPRKLPFGEKSRYKNCPVGPIFNVLQSEVQQHIIDFFADTCNLYKDSSAFKGITVTMWAPTLLWFGSIKSGYDDFTINLFEKENNLQIPVDASDAKRFGKRSEYLLHNHYDLWINWRCRKIAEFIRKIRDVMVQIRPDLILSLTMWNEPFIPAVCDMHTESSQYGNRSSCDKLYMEGGIDLNLFANEQNMEVTFQTEAGNRDRTPSNHAKNLESFYMFRDHDYLDTSVWNKLKKFKNSGVYIFNAWHEAWGEHLWFEAEKDDKNTKINNQLYGKKNCEIFRINSSYKYDGFWWDSQLRISPATPPARHYMEHFIHAIASSDPLKITAGGLYIDKVHTAELIEFAKVFRRLPNEKFETVGNNIDPLAVRQLVKGDYLYLYIVNREPYNIKIDLAFSHRADGVFLADGKNYNGENLTLKSYDFVAMKLAKNLLVSFKIEIEEEIIKKLTNDINQILVLNNLSDKIKSDIRLALEQKQYSRLRHFLTSYPIAKAKDIKI